MPVTECEPGDGQPIGRICESTSGGRHGARTVGLNFSPIAGLTDDDWRVIRLARANLLFVGPDGLVEKIIDALRADFPQPIEAWQPVLPLVLPPVAHTGTLILQDVDAMPGDEQAKLCDWLEATKGRTRVVCTSGRPLFPLLEVGAFADRLYYRLNVLSFHLAECDNNSKLTVFTAATDNK